MSSDTLAAPAPDLSPRAQIALLTLQLRSALREAEEAELAEQQWDVDAALAQLRGSLHPLVGERRAALEVELAQARSEAAARIDSVRVVLDAAAARRDALAAEPDPDPEPLAPIIDEPVIVEAVVDEPVVDEPVVEEATVVEEEIVEEEIVEEAQPVDAVPLTVLPPPPPVAPWSGPSPDVVPLPPPAPLPPPSTSPDATESWRRPSAPGAPLTADDVRAIVSELLAESAARQTAPVPAIDPDAFSRAFAAAFGTALGAALDDRLGGQSFATARYVAPPPKRSFWANMWHADVMMSVLAAVIVLVVLIAWST